MQMDTLWDAKSASLTMVLTNIGETSVAGFTLLYGSLSRTVLPAKTENATLVRRQANFHEYSPPEGLELQPGESWQFREFSVSRTLNHACEGPKWAAVRFANGVRISVFATLVETTTPLQRCSLGGPQSPAILPWPNKIEVLPLEDAAAPGALHVENASTAEMRAAHDIARLTRRLHTRSANVFVFQKSPSTLSLRFSKDTALLEDSYRLTFEGEAVHLSYGTITGCRYGLTSLAQMIVYAWEGAGGFPASGTIEDGPAMRWRGAHLDVSRQIYPTADIHRFLDIMAWHKLNRFHWHLTDDEGWRIEIKAFPELTENAAWTGLDRPILPQLGRSHEGQGGYYTQTEAAEIVAAASHLGIEVVPEIDLPGHSASLLAALPQLADPDEPAENYSSVQGFANNAINPARKQTFEFVSAVLDEICAIFSSDTIHIGGDEVSDDAWQGSPEATAAGRSPGQNSTLALQAKFLQRIDQMLAERHRTTGAWDEAALPGGVSEDNGIIFAWQSWEKTERLLAAGYQVVCTASETCYLDMAQSDHWYAHGASWAGHSTPRMCYDFDPSPAHLQNRHRLLGIQACIWGEHLNTRDQFNHMVFPRLSAIAEVAWTRKDQKSWTRFERLSRYLPRL